MSLAIQHLDLYDQVRSPDDFFRFQARAGVGDSVVIIAGKQEHSPVINVLAHGINKLSDAKVVSGCSAMAIKQFVDDHLPGKKYVIGSLLSLPEADAYRLDYSEIAAEFANQLYQVNSGKGVSPPAQESQ